MLFIWIAITRRFSEGGSPRKLAFESNEATGPEDHPGLRFRTGVRANRSPDPYLARGFGPGR
jgi:hypothetical protein